MATDKWDSAVRPSLEQWIAPQIEDGLSALVALEATGGFELPVAVLRWCGVAVAVMGVLLAAGV